MQGLAVQHFKSNIIRRVEGENRMLNKKTAQIQDEIKELMKYCKFNEEAEELI